MSWPASASRTVSVAVKRAATSAGPRCSKNVMGAWSRRCTRPPASSRPTCRCIAAAAKPRSKVSVPTPSPSNVAAANGAIRRA